MKGKRFLHKIVSFVGREELDFLDKISKDAYFSTGKKISRNQLLREIIRMSKNSNDFNEKLFEKFTGGRRC